MTKDKTVFVSILVLLLFFSACGRLGQVQQEVPRVGVVFYRSEDAFISVLKNELTTRALGKMELYINDSENDQSLQNQQIDDFISRSMDIIAINVVDLKDAEGLLTLGDRKGIPMIFFNREPEGELLETYEDAYYVGTDSSEAGKMQGQLVADSWSQNPEWDRNGDGILQYVLIMGEEGHKDTIERSRLIVETLEARGIQAMCLAEDYGNWSNIEGKALMDGWLEAYGSDIEYVISNNDAMAMGALASLQEDGYFSKDKYMPVVGVDGIPEFMLKVQNGLAVGTVINDAKGQSEAIVDLCMQIWSVKTSLKNGSDDDGASRIIRVPYILITEENVHQFIED